MGKARAVLECGACGHRVSQWAGRCPSCGGWGTIAEVKASPVPRSGAEPVPLALEPEETDHRLDTGFDGVDRVLGGGLVPGSVVLLAREPGVGKSTLLLQIVANLGSAGHRSLVASGEETRSQVAGRARRLAIASDETS